MSLPRRARRTHTLPHIATPVPPHTTAHRRAQPHTAAHRITPQRTATHCSILRTGAHHCKQPYSPAEHCSSLSHRTRGGGSYDAGGFSAAYGVWPNTCGTHTHRHKPLHAPPPQIKTHCRTRSSWSSSSSNAAVYSPIPPLLGTALARQIPFLLLFLSMCFLPLPLPLLRNFPRS